MDNRILADYRTMVLNFTLGQRLDNISLVHWDRLSEIAGQYDQDALSNILKTKYDDFMANEED